MKTLTLQSLARLGTGITLRTRPQAGTSSGLPVVQMKDLGNLSVNVETVSRFDLSPPRNVTFLEPGDIIFRSRGQTNNKAVIVQPGIGRAVLAAPLFLIRVEQEAPVLPGYLRWYINQTPAQRFLARRTEGSLLKMIGLRHLGDLEIPTPALSVQAMIEDVDSLLMRETALLEAIGRKREKYVGNILMRAASKP